MYISKLDRYKYNKGHFFKKISERKRIKNNENYIKLRLNNTLFDDINGVCLDIDQRRIIVSEEDSTLVIAGAGSGKTLTIVGRVIYLVENGVKPSDILVISFTNASSLNLRNKILNNGIEVDVMTFHKLGRKILKDNGCYVTLVSDGILENIVDETFMSYEVLILKKLIITFLNLFKSNNYGVSDFQLFLEQNERKHGYSYERCKLFLQLARDIYIDYQYYLEKNNEIDFYDMINKSIDAVLQKEMYAYKYLIIDEYQDTSLVKCRLIQAIKKNCGCSLLAVGDDFQSIYRFTGTNLKVFTDFESFFPLSLIFKLEKTYRNSKQLLDITSKFILKNKKQIFKRLYSDKCNNKPIYICYYEDDYREVLDDVVKIIGGNDILVLGRNNSNLFNINYRCMTVHKSKGLEADNVIIVGLEDSITGFPCKIVNDEVLKYVVSEEDSILYEEERRLFYVALTRTRNSNYLLVNKNKPSIFVRELISDNDNIVYLKL